MNVEGRISDLTLEENDYLIPNQSQNHPPLTTRGNDEGSLEFRGCLETWTAYYIYIPR